MKVERGNRKLAALAMSLVALTVCCIALAAMKSDTSLFTAVVTGIVTLLGATVYGNVKVHQCGGPDGGTG